MLLNFIIEGFCSIRSEQELTFSSFKGQRITGTKYEYNYMLDNKYRPVKSSVIFGNNATGKTNLLLGLDVCVSMLKDGKIQRSKDIFNHHSDYIKFVISLANEEDEYEYAIKYDADKVQEEYLKKNEKDVFVFSDNTLKSQLLPPAVLEIFSMESSGMLLDKLKDFSIKEIYREFMSLVERLDIEIEGFISVDSKDTGVVIYENSKKLLEDSRDTVLDIFQYVDKSIIDFTFQEVLTKDGEIGYETYFVRGTESGEELFSLVTESKGVKRIFYLLNKLLNILNQGHTLVIDEFDSTIGAKALIKLYNGIINSPVNKKGQLIVSSHNLILLNLDFFAAEQIYFVKKNDNLETIVYSLADYDVRSGKKGLVENFLAGAFD